MARALEIKGGGLRTFLRFAPWVGAGCLLLAPLVAMQFSGEVDWTGFDFMVMGLMMLAVLIPWELAVRTSRDLAHLAGCALTLGGCFVLLWVTLAVGVIGSEDNAANLMFFAVIGAAVLGAVVSLVRGAGMARTLFAMAVLQVGIGAIALAGQLGAEGERWPVDVTGVTAFFALLWLVAGILFRLSARTQAAATAG